MKIILISLLSILFMQNHLTIFDFQNNDDANQWLNVDDVVMGGVSNGNIDVDNDGNGVFYGKVSLENNGGFCSIRHKFKKIDSQEFSKFVLKVKGDTKRYQFRVKTGKFEMHSYIAYFETSGEWQTIEIPFSIMYASFRGRRLDKPNFPGKKMTEISLLINNNKAEEFKLIIDKITIK